MEVLYHIRPYFVGIFPYIALIYGRYLHFRFLKWPWIYGGFLKWGYPPFSSSYQIGIFHEINHAASHPDWFKSPWCFTPRTEVGYNPIVKRVSRICPVIAGTLTYL